MLIDGSRQGNGALGGQTGQDYFGLCIVGGCSPTFIVLFHLYIALNWNDPGILFASLLPLTTVDLFFMDFRLLVCTVVSLLLPCHLSSTQLFAGSLPFP